ncbi:MAG TPA: hypothetical protein VN256_10455 [Pyrinomonadaceae bacterium]|nr:hypothetical protein [Pyrinomonadaceae bacterium]
MNTVTLDQPVTGSIIQGSVPISLPLPKPDSNLSLLINAPGILYRLEAPIVDRPVIEDGKISARFIVDDDVYLHLNLIGQSIEQENKFKSGQFSLVYIIEEQRPRAHFVANTLLAAIGLVGRFELKISEPAVNTDLNFEASPLEISRMLKRRQTAYRLMVIEKVTGKQFLLPSAFSEREIERIAFVYHAIVDRSFIWPGGSLNISATATQENAFLFAQAAQSPSWPIPEQPFSEIILGQPINLGRAVVTIEDAVVRNADEVRKQLEAGDGREVTTEVHSLSGRDRYEFTEMPYSAQVSWEPKIQALIDLEPHLDAAITERYHGLAAATLEGLTEKEKEEITTRPELGEAFLIDDSDGE